MTTGRRELTWDMARALRGLRENGEGDWGGPEVHLVRAGRLLVLGLDAGVGSVTEVIGDEAHSRGPYGCSWTRWSCRLGWNERV
jgi:hypothetical protein